MDPTYGNPDENQSANERLQYLVVFDNDTDIRIGHASSLGAEGLTVIGPRAYDPGEHLNLRIAWNRNAGWTETIRIDGEVLHSTAATGSGQHAIEIVFRNASEQATTEIERILREEPHLTQSR